MSDERDLATSIAVVGMSGRFPGAASVEELWRNLLDGVEAITRFTDDELLASGVAPDLVRDPSYVKAGRVLDDIDLFDAGFFALTPREAQLMDPQHRLFLEQAWTALEDAGVDPSRFPGAIGVFAGSALSTYLVNNLAPNRDLDEAASEVQVVLGNDKDSLATRAAYALGLRGPCYSVQSYCSTSLVAVCAAATSLLTGECDLALAGGAAVTVPDRVGYLFVEGGMSSPDARCRTFDAAAQGTPIGNGVALVALKRAEDALADGDDVYALLRGWAINNDGSAKAGFTAPGVRGQAAVVAEALANAGVAPAEIGYVEAHGTGTALGDAAEITALKQVFTGLPRGSCRIGAVKTNLGHLDRAAGVTGLIKAALSVRHGVIPPTINFERPNPQAGLDDSAFEVVTERCEWIAPAGRRAGVSAFGIGGTNAHVVVEEPPPLAPVRDEARPRLLVVSGRTDEAADRRLDDLAERLEGSDVALGDVAWTLATARREFECRRALVASSVDEAAVSFGDGGGVISGRAAVAARPVGFLVAGVGEHYAGLAGGLYAREPVFRQAFDECAARLEDQLSVDLGEVLFGAPGATNGSQPHALAAMLGREPANDGLGLLARTAVSQPAMFAVQLALARLLESWGVAPAAIVGYSLGEYVAACLSGALELDEALALVAERARLIDALPQGAMLAVALGEHALRERLGEDLDVAAINAPQLTVAAGPVEAIEALRTRLAEQDVAARPLSTTHAFHSRMLEPIAEPLTAWVREHVRPRAPRVPYVSNLTGRFVTEADLADPGYWARHATQTVRFADGLGTLLADADLALAELGPGQSLGAMARQHPACERERWGRIVGLLPARHDPTDAHLSALRALAKLWVAGTTIDWHGLTTDHADRRRVRLPSYPFQRQRYWIDPPERRAAPACPAAEGGVRLYRLGWERAASVAAGEPVQGPVLLFADATGLGDDLAALLREDDVEVLVVRAGDGFSADGDTFAVRPGDADDHRALAERLARDDRVPRTVAHLWNVDGQPGEDDPDAVEARQRHGFADLARLAAALDAVAREPIRVAAVSDAMHAVLAGEVAVADKATAGAVCKVVPQEHPDVHCRSVDVDLADDGLAAALRDELRWPEGPATVAWRGGERWTERVHETEAPADAAVELREGGAYLITGGLGGVGMLLCEHLVRTLKASVALTARTALPARETWAERISSAPDTDESERLRRLLALEDEDGEVLVLAADVADEQRMRDVVAEVRSSFGRLDGVVHAAGVTGPESFRPLQHLDDDAWRAHFAAKVRGTVVLERVLRDEPLDFVLLQSSMSAILGGLGFASYAAANAFLDAVAARHRDDATPWLSVDWDTWEPTVRKLESGPGGLGASLVEHALSVEEAFAALRDALALGLPRVAVAVGDLPARMRRWLTSELADEAAAQPARARADRFARPELPEAFVPADSRHEKLLADLWAEVLGLEEVGVDDNFFDLGGNSLMGLQLITRVKRELKVRVPAVALFEAPTIRTLARYLDTELGDGAPAADAGLRRRRRRSAATADDAVAIIGMAGRFPGAGNVGELWRNLREGVESVRFFTEDELRASGVPDELIHHPQYVPARPVVDGIEDFDAGLFGYSPREAVLHDPQHRLFLECCFEALEDSGYGAPDDASVGVFGGTNLSTYLLRVYGEPELLEGLNDYQAIIGNDKDALTTTVSYKLDLQGPSVAVQTFCSTSLVAVHLACRSLLDGECDRALAGGVSIRVPDRVGHLYEPGGQASPDGHVRAFDADAGGSMFGDGVAVVTLKRLSDAREDGDRVLAVIRGSAINNDGSLKVGFTAPSVVGQAQVIRDALDVAGVDPQDISYVEAHGTATELGDPIEVAALQKAFGRHDRSGWCALGSVKTNLGHLDRAAGVTGLIKTVLALRHEELPPTLHYRRPNAEIDFDGSPFFVSAELRPWRRARGRPRRAGVSSLGMGGTNAHVIVEEAPVEPPAAAPPQREPQLLVVSGKTQQAADDAVQRLAAHLRTTDDALADVAWTLGVGRREFEHRRALVTASPGDAAVSLADGGGVASGRAVIAPRPVGFLLAGVGEHYAGLASGLYRDEPVFREAFDACAQRLGGVLGVDLAEALFTEPAATGGPARADGLAAMLGRTSTAEGLGPLASTAVSQPAMFALEYALARLLARWGVAPSAMAGYSLGEYVAACLSGALELDEALGLVAERARLIDALPAGAMLGVALGEDALRELLGDRLDVAAVNAPALSVAAGPVEAVEELERRLAERDVAARRLATTHAFHSRMLEPIRAPLTEWAREHVHPRAPRVPYVSNVTGRWVTEEDLADPGYWGRHATATVRFAEALETLLADADLALAELGPGQSLGAMARQHPACDRERWGRIVSLLPARHDPTDATVTALNALARLWVSGTSIDWQGAAPEPARRRRVRLPSYPFQRQRYWIEPADGGAALPAPAPAPAAGPPADPAAALVSLPREETEDWLHLPAWRQAAPAAPAGRLSGDWLVLTAEGEADRVTAALEASGAGIVRVRAGARFARVDRDEYVVRPRNLADWRRLVKDLIEQERGPLRGLHLWSLGEPGEDAAERDLAFEGLAGLARAMGDAADAPWTLEALASRTHRVLGDEPLLPARTTLVGPTRVLPLEYRDLRCRLIDVETADAGWFDEALAELDAEPAGDVVALRRGRRWTPTYERITPEADPRPFRPGTYLVTGGLGAIALGLAEELVRDVDANLVLAGRSGLPPRDRWPALLASDQLDDRVRRRIESVQRLEDAGADVLVVEADVTAEASFGRAVAAARERFGRIDAVLHTAGVPAMGLLRFKTPEVTDEVFAPKVAGSETLARCLADDPPDLLVLFSSISSAMGGGPGQAEYCAANAYMDAFAQVGQAAPRIVSVNWGEWKWNAWESAQAGYPEEAKAFFRENRERFGIAIDEGYLALRRAVASGLRQVVVSTQDFPSIVSLSRYFTVDVVSSRAAQAAGGVRHPRPDLSTSFVSPSGEIEEKIAASWAAALGLEEVGAQDNFFDLGGNSLIGVDLVARIRTELHALDLPPHALYEAPTVAALARVVSGEDTREDRGGDRRERAELRRERLARAERA
ncbi:MAG TPA: SDR family NAD(P)-dependent oxidoreductase [Solirubrobacteraceae bacterium]|nr:SDR family NAD(P)-dependent oxidoreductase [Solirubrobacteraceae bacterium]